MMKIMPEKKTTIEIHAMNPDARKLLDAAYDEYETEYGEGLTSPYRVLYWFIRWSETFQAFAGERSERVVVMSSESK